MKTKKSEKLNEYSELPRHHARINPTGLATKYWVAIDDYSDKLTNYSMFVDQSLNQKPCGKNAVPSTTVDKQKAVQLAKRAIAKWPNKYVFVGQDKSSHGMQTGMNHLRASTLYIWSPKYQMWNDYVDESKKFDEAVVTTMKRLPFAIQRVLSLPGDITYCAIFDDDAQEQYIKNRARQLSVKLNYDPKDEFMNVFAEGTLVQLFKFILMTPHKIVSDRGFTDGIEYEAGLTLTIQPQYLRKITPQQFTEFVNWIGQSYPDFVEGIKENNNLSKFYKA